jgi:hemoglobin-like flavoprotein
MTLHQIQLVQSSWNKVKPLGAAAGELFYTKLFEAAPSVRHLFNHNIKPQADKLVYMLSYIVAKLDRLDTLTDDIRKLAARHADYGAEPAHYEVVGQCLIATLQDALPDVWDEELQQAWVTAYTILADAMIGAQQQFLVERA